MKPRSPNPLPETAGEVITILSDLRLYDRGRDATNFGHHLGQITWTDSIICPIETISFSLGKTLNVFIKCRTNLDMCMIDKLNFNDLFLNEVCVGRICAHVCMWVCTSECRCLGRSEAAQIGCNWRYRVL